MIFRGNILNKGFYDAPYGQNLGWYSARNPELRTDGLSNAERPANNRPQALVRLGATFKG